MDYENRNIGAIIAEWAERDPDVISVEFQDERHSRADIMHSAAHLAAQFAQEGVLRGDAVCLLVGDPLRGMEAMIGLWSLGAVVQFLDPRQPLPDIERTKQSVGIKAVFTDSPAFARKGVGTLLVPRDRTDRSHPPLSFPEGSGHDHALIISSSGTTGTPKFMYYSHDVYVRGLVFAGKQVGRPVPKPSILLATLAFGATLGGWVRGFIFGRFIHGLPLFVKVEEVHEAMKHGEAEGIALPPVMIRDLLEFQKKISNKNNLPAYPHIDPLISVGGPISPEDLVAAYKNLTPGVRNIYSMSGVGAVSVMKGKDILQKANSVGKLLPGVDVRILGPDGEDRARGDVGEIIATAVWAKGAKPVNTGDMGWMDDEGFLYVTGRTFQMATRNSVNVNLQELENEVKSLHGVRDCVAFSSKSQSGPDDEIFLAVESRADSEDVRRQLRQAIASFRRPDMIYVGSALPRNQAAKLNLRTLKDMAEKDGGGFAEF